MTLSNMHEYLLPFWSHLLLSNGGDLDEDPVAGGEVEVGRLGDDEVGHLGGQDDALRDGRLAHAHHRGDLPVDHLQQEDDPGAHDPLPEVGGVQDEEDPVGPVELEHVHRLNQYVN